jgi:multidrug efflux pump subunit AcrB
MEDLSAKELPQGYGLSGRASHPGERGRRQPGPIFMAMIFVFLVLAARYELGCPVLGSVRPAYRHLGRLLEHLDGGTGEQHLRQIGIVALMGLAAKNAV